MHSLFIITVDTIIFLLAKKHFSEVSTSERTKEEATYMLFIDLFHQCEGGPLFYIHCTDYLNFANSHIGIFNILLYIAGEIPGMELSDVLSFFTGSRYPPPIEYDTQPTLNFKSDAMYPLASTCALQLTLPTMYHSDPTAFQDKVVFGMKNHGGFGLF